MVRGPKARTLTTVDQLNSTLTYDPQPTPNPAQPCPTLPYLTPRSVSAALSLDFLAFSEDCLTVPNIPV